MRVKSLLGAAIQDGLQARGVCQAEYSETEKQRIGISDRSEGREMNGLGIGLRGANNRERFGKHTLEARMRVKVNRRHETWHSAVSDRGYICGKGRIYMIGMGEYGSK